MGFSGTNHAKSEDEGAGAEEGCAKAPVRLEVVSLFTATVFFTILSMQRLAKHQGACTLCMLRGIFFL